MARRKPQVEVAATDASAGLEGSEDPSTQPTLPPTSHPDCVWMFRDGERIEVNLNSTKIMAGHGWSLNDADPS